MNKILEPFRDYHSGASSRKMNRIRWAMVALSWLIYVLVFPTLYNLLGPIALSFSGIPVFFTSWQAGLWGGILSAIGITLVNGLLLYWTGDNWSHIFRCSWLGFCLLLFGGAVVGRLHDLGRQIVNELNEHRRTAQKYSSIVESSIDGIILVNEYGKIMEWNQGEEELTGLKQAEVLGKFIWDVFYQIQPETQKVPSERDQYRENIIEALKTGKGYWLKQLNEREIQHKDGTRFYIQIQKSPIKTSTGYMIGIFSRDITERKKTELILMESEERFRATITQSSDGILVADENLKIIEWSSSQTEIFGYTRDEMIGKPIWQFQYDSVPEEHRPPGFLKHIKERALQIRDQGGDTQEENKKDYEIQTKDGGRKTIQISSFPIKTSGGILFGTITRDISEQKQFEKHLQHAATHDSLTDLPNRNLLNDRLIHSIANAERGGEQLALFYIDLDDFKIVNDTYGHSVGDELLRQFTKRILDQTRKSDTFARVSGDEFIMILESLPDRIHATTVAEKVISVGSEPYQIDDLQVSTTLSIGICLYPDNGNEPSLLIQRADAALYQAKQTGKNNLQFYNPK